MKRRPVLIVIALGILLVTAAPALADEPGGKNKMPGWPVRWKATSPSTHEGDRYTLRVTNTSDEVQEAQIRTRLMDHPEVSTSVIDEKIELEPGEERELTTVNDYGTAEHFNTIIGSETQDLDLAVSIDDAAGMQTAQFNQAAFQTQEGKAKANVATADKHGHDEEFAIFLPTALRDVARLSPLSLGVLAVTGTGLYAVRRRWAWSGPTSGRLAEAITLPPALPRVRAWKAVAVGGLVLGAALHIGLAPEHFEEAAAQGIFFYAAGVVAAIIAAAILAWPSRFAYLSGAGISLALIVLWVVFRIVPPPGSETAEAVDLIGMLAKGTELVAAAACIVLWLRARRASQPDRTGFQAS